MLLDKQTQLEDGTAITVTRVSTNVIDLSVARDINPGEPIEIVAISDGLFASSGSTGTLQVAAQGSVDNATFVNYALSPVLTQAQLNTLGIGQQPFILPIDWPGRVAGAAKPRYLRLNFTVASGPFTAGSIKAWLALGKDEIEFYPRNYSVAGLY